MDFIPSVVGNCQRVCRRGFTFDIPIDAMNKKKKVEMTSRQLIIKVSQGRDWSYK